MNIPFGDLKRHYASLKQEIDKAVKSVLDSGWFVLGPQVRKFEESFAAYCDASFAVGVGSGTEAIHLALRALGIGPGDEVITAANTCVPTVAAIAATGARVCLADVSERYLTIDPADIERRISPRTRAIVPVHLYGAPADLDEIHRIAATHGISVVEDAAQAHGTEYHHHKIGALSALTAFSFYPSKNLGAFGDGGAVTTNDAVLAERLLMIRNYGERERYYHALIGYNSRLDELQAAILQAMLPHLDSFNARRDEIAAQYRTLIQKDCIALPAEITDSRSNNHLFVVRVKARSRFREYLAGRGISTQIHYPVPIHMQEAYGGLGYRKGDFPVSEAACAQVLSLPMFPELTDQEIDYVCSCINQYHG